MRGRRRRNLQRHKHPLGPSRCRRGGLAELHAARARPRPAGPPPPAPPREKRPCRRHPGELRGLAGILLRRWRGGRGGRKVEAAARFGASRVARVGGDAGARGRFRLAHPMEARFYC